MKLAFLALVTLVLASSAHAILFCDDVSLRTQSNPCFVSASASGDNSLFPDAPTQPSCTAKTQSLVSAVKSVLNMPYVWGADSDGEGGYDCSGLIYSKVKDVTGQVMPRTSNVQSRWIGSYEIPRSQARAGDLVYFWTSARRQYGHTGIMVDSQRFVHASSGKGRVTTSTLDSYVASTGYGLRVRRIRPLDC